MITTFFIFFLGKGNLSRELRFPPGGGAFIIIFFCSPVCMVLCVEDKYLCQTFFVLFLFLFLCLCYLSM
ncbi:hypothetical protein QBC44DRAFT_321961 [Cladorrhinum sp. PSN332]|nr:hypothetical protein QBC44DRAFT_321961 [Cladorrhinum sp. PSN332]